MDITSIEQAIEELEAEETTLDNITELSALYIVRNNFPIQSSSHTSQPDSGALPCYSQYVQVKRDYQLNQTTEGAVIKEIKTLCGEISEFFDKLYSNTDMAKERRCIAETIEKIHIKYKN